MPNELEKALKDGNIINIDKNSLNSSQEKTNPTVDLHFQIGEKFEKFNLPIGLEYHKSYSPYHYLAIDGILEYLTHIPLNSKNLHIDIQNYRNKLNSLPRIRFFSKFNEMLTSLPTVISLFMHYSSNSNLNVSKNNFSNNFFKCLTILCSLQILSSSEIQHSDAKSTNWISKNEMQQYTSITKLERRLFLKKHPNQTENAYYPIKMKFLFIYISQTFLSLLDTLTLLEQEFLQNYVGNKIWLEFKENWSNLIVNEKWPQLFNLLKQFPSLSFSQNSKKLMDSKNLSSSYKIGTQSDLNISLLIHTILILA